MMITIEFFGCENKISFKELSDKIKRAYYFLPPYLGEIEIKNMKGFVVNFNQSKKEIEMGEKISVMVTSNNRIEAEKISLIFEMLGFDF